MARSTKLILCILLLLLLSYPIFATCYNSYIDPAESELTITSANEIDDQGYMILDEDGNPVEDQDDFQMSEGEVPSEKPDGDMGEEPPDGYGGGTYMVNTQTEVVYHISSSSIILLVIETMVFAMILCYLICTKFCKDNFKDVLKMNKSVSLIYLLLTFSIWHALSFGLLYLVQNLITNNIY